MLMQLNCTKRKHLLRTCWTWNF